MGTGTGLRAGGHPVSEDQPVSVSTSFPAPVVLDSPSALALTILVAFMAVLFAYSYETCIYHYYYYYCNKYVLCAVVVLGPGLVPASESLSLGCGSCHVPVLSVLFRAA